MTTHPPHHLPPPPTFPSLLSWGVEWRLLLAVLLAGLLWAMVIVVVP